jgi:hypothetical protein
LVVMTVERFSTNNRKVSFGAFRGEELIAKATHLITNWRSSCPSAKSTKLHSIEALEHHGWSCARCHGSRRLQIHHRRFRSHGGTPPHRNLEGVCCDRHIVIHRLERSA